MSRILLAAALVLIPAPAVAQSSAVPAAPADREIDPAALATAREIIRVGFPEEQRTAMFGQVVDSMSAQVRSAMMGPLNNDPGAKAIVERKLTQFLASGKAVMVRHIPAFMDAYAKAFAREFSPAELIAILDFVKTPAGSRFLSRSSVIVSDPAFAAANEAYLRELQPLMQAMQMELRTEMRAYLSQNPPKPTRPS